MNPSVLDYFVEVINTGSLRYSAEIADEPFPYLRVSSAVPCLCRVLVIHRRKYVRLARLVIKIAIYEKDLTAVIGRKARHDRAFSESVNKRVMSADDVESIVSELTCGRVHLHLKRRTYLQKH